MLWNIVTRHFALKIWWDEFECLATLKAWFLKMDNSTIHVQHRNSSWYVLKESVPYEIMRLFFNMIGPLQNTITRCKKHRARYPVRCQTRARLKTKRFFSRTYCFAIVCHPARCFCTMWTYSSQIWDPCKALRLRPKPGRTA